MFLERIIASVDRRVDALKPQTAELVADLPRAPAVRSLTHALRVAAQAQGVGVIAECKHRSPSKGWLVDRYEPRQQADRYQAAGAAGISVLTEPEYFAGAMDHLRAVRQTVQLPVLCKDFIRDPLQLVQARAAGADAALLIVRIIDDPGRLAELRAAARGLGLEVLVEIHHDGELDRALALEPDLLGVNNRDLDTFETHLEFSERIADRVPQQLVKVSESGIGTPADVAKIRGWGYQAVLVGESLMRGGRLLEQMPAWP
ncbi:MAG: indole-3-glycerol phosphate synthase TrpC [Thermaerobacter sp.]|nr:indole-3-glycerol phosphate synthase TrpC [Thermaerobacter sp.]